MLYKFKLDHNTVEATKNICYAKVEGAADYNSVTRWIKKFCSGCKKLNNQTRLGRPKIGNSKVVLQDIVANPVSEY